MRDDLSSHPVSGAKVVFVSDTLDTTETHSDGNGHYVLEVTVREGVNFGTLQASLSGYQTSPKATVFFDGTARTVDMRLRASGK